jgi:hypothetical protein
MKGLNSMIAKVMKIIPWDPSCMPQECALLAFFCIYDTKKIPADALGTLKEITRFHASVSPKVVQDELR